MPISSSSTGGLKTVIISHTSLYQGSSLRKPESQWWKLEILFQWDEEPVLAVCVMYTGLSSDVQGMNRSSPKRATSTHRDSKDPSSSDDNSWADFSKEYGNKFLQENQQYYHLPNQFSFYALGKNPQLGFPFQTHTESMHLWASRCSVVKLS